MSQKIEATLFEDALNATGFGLFNVLQLLLSSLLIIAMICESFAMSYLVVGSACELGTDSVQQGLMAGMPLVGIILTSHFWGYLADTRGRKKILIFSLILALVGGTLSAFSPNWIVLCIFKMLSSSALSGTFALSMTLLSECTPAARRSSLVILANSVYITIPGLMAVTTIPILSLRFSYYIPFLGIHFNSWRLLSLVFTFPCALGILSMYLTCESPKYLLSVGEEKKALEVLRTIFVINKRKPREEFKVTSLVLDESSSTAKQGLWESMKSQTIPLMKPPLLKNTIVLSSSIVCIYICVNSFMVWLPLIADSLMRAVALGETDRTLCQMMSANAPQMNATVVTEEPCTLDFQAMVMVFSIQMLYSGLNCVLTVLVNYVGRKKLIISIQLIAGVCGITLNLITGWVFSAILFILYLSPMLVMGLVTSYTVDIFPTYLRAMAVCLTLMMGRGSGIVGINVLKQLLFTNCEASFYLFSSISLVGVIVASFLPKDKSTVKKGQEA